MAAASRQNRLFTLRLWQDETGDGQLEWRGKVQALPQGEICYFRSWAGLVERLEAMLIGETVVPPFNAREVRMSVESGSPGIAQGDPNPGRRVG